MSDASLGGADVRSVGDDSPTNNGAGTTIHKMHVQMGRRRRGRPCDVGLAGVLRICCDPVTRSATMPEPPLTLLIDGACPLCRREGAWLRRLDRGRNRLRLADISAAEFDPAAYGLTSDAVAARMHAVLPDGAVVTGMEAFRRAYAAVGWGWLLAPTGWPLLRPLCNAGYAWFARNRHRLTGRAGVCNAGACDAISPAADNSSSARRRQ